VINAKQLLVDLTRQLKGLEADLRQRIAEQPDLNDGLRAEWQAALDAKRCAETFETWADQVITQAGVHWLLSCVFLRFIEDNQLVDRPWLAGTPESGRLALARDRHEDYFRTYPLESDRDYLLSAFREAGTLPGLRTFFDEAHNPVFRLGISGDAAMALRQFWQQVDTDSGLLLRDFTDPTWNTRFLGDLYQDLSEATRKRYALLQTPEFVEEFILDRTLTPAIHSFGFRAARMIDPTCGSGHFLLGGFARLVDEWQRNEPGRNARDIAQKALDAVAGVDLNPFAVAISRFRLLVAALRVAGVQRLNDAPTFVIHVAIGDSLLHGMRFGQSATQDLLGHDQYRNTGLEHAYATEDLTQVKRILDRQYHAVVGNPPYIVVRDAALNAAYRDRYASCHRQYSLGCPFTERFFELAITGERFGQAGYVGLITANSFMKREFGSKLIEQVLPRLDLTHVIDTSGAYIPGHGTPTVILLGCHRPPHDELNSASNTVRAVMGIKGEPCKPDVPAHGLVWRAIVDQIDRPGSETEFVSVADTPRSTLSRHPWSIGGGGATDLKAAIEGEHARLGPNTTAIGRVTHTGADEVYFGSAADWQRRGIDASNVVGLIEGNVVRDWSASPRTDLLFPYDDLLKAELVPGSNVASFLWLYKQQLAARREPGGTHEEIGLTWFEWSRFQRERFLVPLGITYADIATHNHFVLDRGGKVFNRTAPVIKLPAGSSEGDHLGLLGLLNSSVACFWLQQVCHNKGGPGGGSSKDEKWHDFYAFNSTQVAEFPLAATKPLALAKALDAAATERSRSLPAALMDALPLSRQELDSRRAQAEHAFGQMVALQEELDWQCYGLYNILDGAQAEAVRHSSPPPLRPGERAFEIVMARELAAGSLETRWFEWLNVEPIAELPAHWTTTYKDVVERRIALIKSDRNIGLIEAPSCKRRWEMPAWDDLEKAALRDWLLNRLEQPAFWPVSADTPPQLTTTNRLADLARADAAFMQAAALYAGHADFDPARLVAELVAAEAVPLLPAQRYTDDGLRKRAQWEDTWALQRREDAIDAQVVAEEADGWHKELAATARTTFGSDTSDEARAWIDQKLAAEIKRYQDERKAAEIGPIPVPPKYKSSDFLKADFWRLRGGLDVPKERFVSFPGAERGADGSLPIAWAGWNHLQLATALAGYYVDMKDTDGWEPARLQPLLAGLLELVPWLEQWHNDLDPVFGERMGTYYKGFVTEEARSLGFTLDDLRTWKPTAVAAKRGRKKATREA
jgi:hypothetical protein